MRKEEKLKLNLESICIYNEIFKDSVGKKFTTLVNKISNEDSFGDCIVAYNEFVYALYKNNSKLSFKENLVDEMLLATNPFTLRLEKYGDVSDFVKIGLKNELDSLSNILKITSDDIKEILLSRFADDVVVERKINGLLDWGKDKENYIEKNNGDYEKLKKKLMDYDDWTKYTDDIVKFHIENGTGRATAYSAFVWERFENDDEGRLREIAEPDPIKLDQLVGYELQKKDIIDNTKQFLNGIPANNLLLYGSRGTGKSSTVKAILNEYAKDGLRLIEVDKEQLSDFTRIIRLLKHKKQKFIIFVDDLVFQENEASYSALKTILEGRVENRPENILIYATTNRRHLVQEKFSDEDEINSRDTREEKLSLADRFGITISFFPPNQKEYLEIVDGIVKEKGIEVDTEYLHSEALKWEKWHNGRSPRSARQFIAWLEGELKNKDK